MASTIATMTGEPRELNQGGTSTSEVVFTTDGSTAVICYLPDSEQLASANGHKSSLFKVYAWGRVTGGTTTNYTAQLQYGTSSTPGSNTDIEALSARAVNSESGNWFIEATLCWDATSNKIQGYAGGITNNVGLDADAVINNEITSSDPDGNTGIGFVVTGTFSSGNASNTAHLDGFVIERIGG